MNEKLLFGPKNPCCFVHCKQAEPVVFSFNENTYNGFALNILTFLLGSIDNQISSTVFIKNQNSQLL